MAPLDITEGLFRRGRDPWRFLAAFVALAAIADSAICQENDATSSWSGSVSLRAMSRLTQYGLDAAPERATIVAGGSIAHDAGVTVSVSSALQPAPWTAQRTSLSVGYEASIGDPWVLELSLAHSWYPAGSTNPLAASPTSAGIALSYDGDLWSFGADLERYTGGAGATYATADASIFVAGDGFSLLPILSVSFGSQTVTSAVLKRGKGRTTAIASAVTTVTGLSSIDGMVVVIVPLGSGWSASAMPGLMYSPSDLASTSTRFTWSVGVRKTL